MAPTNQAAWLMGKSVRPLVVKPAPYTPPGANEIVVKNGAIAPNPFEWFKQDSGNLMCGWVKYPFVMGSDLAGEVVEVGQGVTRFKVGDRVLGHAVGMDKRSNKSSEGAFQSYTVIRTNLAAPIPSSMSYEEACVIPLCASTAACGLYMQDFLALPYPSISPKPTGKTLLVWGGSTAVGSNAIQLARASGFDVITTASPKNFDYVKRLGAVEAYDYKSPTVVRDVIAAFQTRESAGALAVGPGSLKICMEIQKAVKGRKFVSQATFDVPGGKLPSNLLEMMSLGISLGVSGASAALKSQLTGLRSKFIFGSDLVANDVGRALYEDFLPAALAQGSYIAAPEPWVVGTGLDKVQEALDINKKGVSVKKVVLTL